MWGKSTPHPTPRAADHTPPPPPPPAPPEIPPPPPPPVTGLKIFFGLGSLPWPRTVISDLAKIDGLESFLKIFSWKFFDTKFFFWSWNCSPQLVGRAIRLRTKRSPMFLQSPWPLPWPPLKMMVLRFINIFACRFRQKFASRVDKVIGRDFSG